jgi:uncharacterized protein involved in exopolysaccharide biosynthesis
MQQYSENPYNLLHLIGIVYRWRRQLLYFVLGAVLLTAVISLFIPNYYTASATFAPANEDKELFSKVGSKNNSLYGDEDAVDRALIFAESGPLVEFMIEEFKLSERYGIDASTPKGQDKVARRFRKLYDVKKNEHSGIEVSIQDTDPQVAAQMIEKLLYKLERMYKEATQPNKKLLNQTYEASLKQKGEEVKALMDSLAFLRQRYGIYDPLRQAELLSELLVNSEAQLVSDRAKLSYYQQVNQNDSIRVLTGRIQGNEQRLKMLRGSDSLSLASAINTQAFTEGADLVSYYQRRLLNINEEISDLNAEYDKFKAQLNSQASSIIVLEPVRVPKVKSYPVRSLLVIGVGLLALFLGLVAAIVLDLYKKVDWSTVISDETTPNSAQ